MALIEITLPDELEKQLNAAAKDRVQFIIEAIKTKLEEQKSGRLRHELIEGYSASRNENLSLLNDFDATDVENWDEY